MELADRPGCYLWNPAPVDNETVTWSGGCSNGLAQGNGRVNWYENGELNQIEETGFRDGRRDGLNVVRDANGNELFRVQYQRGRVVPAGRWT